MLYAVPIGEHGARKRVWFGEKTDNIIVEDQHGEHGVRLRCVHVVHLLAVDEQRLPDFERIASAVAKYVERSLRGANEFAIGVPMQKIVRIAVFARPNLPVVGIIPNFTFCDHFSARSFF